MRRNAMIFGACALLLGLSLVACGGGKEADDTTVRDAQWAELQSMQQDLQHKRAELAAAMAAPEPEEAAEGEETAGEETEAGEGAEAGAEIDVAALQKAVDEATQKFNEQLVAFINENPPIVGEPLTERQQAAIRMKSDEDIVLAREYIDRGGDYRRAIKIYEAALTADPDYERLKQEMAEAEDMRFMNEERFALAKKGMTEPEVRELLGPANLRNIRHFEDENVTAWYYPKDERGAAAAVWFREDAKKKALVVYQLDYDATPGSGEEEES